jgi:hypothetical protein
MAKVAKFEKNGDEKNKIVFRKDYDVEALITLCGEMESKFVKTTQKKVKSYSSQCISLHIVHAIFESNNYK